MPLLAFIREAECIGCAKCIEACPADAILGSRKMTHTVIAEECIGCALCLPPCPVDCIDMVENVGQLMDKEFRLERARHFRERYQVRAARLKHKTSTGPVVIQAIEDDEKKAYIKAALLRVQLKKQENDVGGK
jgi:electron transport complex protein RnfB